MNQGWHCADVGGGNRLGGGWTTSELRIELHSTTYDASVKGFIPAVFPAGIAMNLHTTTHVCVGTGAIVRACFCAHRMVFFDREDARLRAVTCQWFHEGSKGGQDLGQILARIQV